MSKISWGVVIVVIGFLFYFSLQKNMTNGPSTSKINIIPVEHASAVITWGDKIIYTDPVGELARFDGKPAPTLILLTDIHGDHLDFATLEALSANEITLVMPQVVADASPETVPGKRVILKNGEMAEVGGVNIEAIPMYNLPDAENANFHTKGRGNGYLLSYGGKRVYIAGDTAGIPEMRALEDIDIALVSMNLPYTMSVEEAADAVLDFAPRQVYPYHYRGQDGLSDVNKFKELVNAGNPDIGVVLLDWYPEN